MYNIIPLSLILIGLAVIAFIVAKKFPVLSNIDVENIPSEKEARVKETIASRRIKRNLVWFGSRFSRFVSLAYGISRKLFNLVYSGLHKIKNEYGSQTHTERNEPEAKNEFARLINESERLVGQENYEEAERKLIEAIGIDSKQVEAFKLLAEVYEKKGNYSEARQTLEHVLRLREAEEADLVNHGGGAEDRFDELEKERGQINFDLATIERAENDYEGAKKRLEAALKIEPKNPRYLDTMIETSIMLKDKISALDAYDKLAEINPENGKLQDFKRQIKEL